MTIAKAPSPATLASSLWPLYNLTQFVQNLGHATKLPSLAEHILAGLLEVSQSSQGALYLLNRDREEYRHVYSHGMHDSIDEPSAIACSHPLVQSLTRGHQIRTVSDLAFLSPATSHEMTTDSPLANLPMKLAIPLLSHGQMIAFVLIQTRTETSAFPALTTELLTGMAQCAALSLDSLLLYENLPQSHTIMRRADRLRSVELIAGGFSHEIRNPLTSIKTFIQLARERKDDGRFIGEFGHIVLDDVYRIEHLVQEMLDYARYREPTSTDEDFNEIVVSCINFIQAQADRRGIKIEKELALQLPRGMVDRQQIQQVIMNLLLNAIDAIGGNHGTIHVQTKLRKTDEQEWVDLEIADTGRGISTEHRAHIFDQLSTTNRSGAFNDGTELSLTIVHQIVTQHGGTITAQSAEGIGTTIRVQLLCHRL